MSNVCPYNNIFDDDDDDDDDDNNNNNNKNNCKNNHISNLNAFLLPVKLF